MSLEQFFSMGGYAFYVWTSYGIAMAVLLINFIAPLRRKSEVLKSIARMIRQERAKP
jgi:heme exporter protein D